MDKFRNEKGQFKKGYTPPWYYTSLPKRSGSNHYNWKGGEYWVEDGYVLVHKPNHPNARTKGRVLAHRLIMEENIGRYLHPWEVVHHKNGKKNDNRIENLELLPSQGNHNTAIQKVYKENERLKRTVLMLMQVMAAGYGA